MADSDPLSTDIDTVARAEIVAAVEYDLGVGNISHESCPDIGAHDWERIAERIKEILKGLMPDPAVRTDAYSRMIARAE